MKHELTVDDLVAQTQKVQGAMKAVMKDGEHYGVIPGTNKPTLLKPGAEKLCVLFRLAPDPVTEKTWHEDGHLTVTAVVKLIHSPTGNFVAAGEGMCSTKESKYAYRNASRKCPQCGVEAIIKGKQEYGGGWVCFKRKDGCGAKFRDGDPSIEGQQVGKLPNPDLADSYNTVLKMATKRALVAAVLNGTAASDIFTQDLDDFGKSGESSSEEPHAARPASPPNSAEEVTPSRKSPPPRVEAPESAPNQDGEAGVAPSPQPAAPTSPPWLKALRKSYEDSAILDTVNAMRAERVKASERIPLDSIEEVGKARKETQEELIKRLAATDWTAPKQASLA